MSRPIRSVAVIGAGASGESHRSRLHAFHELTSLAGAAAAAALSAEQCVDTIRVFERRGTPGGTGLDPGAREPPSPGALAPRLDPPSDVPTHLPAVSPPVNRERWDKTPVYEDLTTNVPAIAMSFSDCPFSYGPFVPHWIPKQNVQEYFARQRTDRLLVPDTTVEDVAKLPHERWALTLRRYDAVADVDRWWREDFDALIIANGHYSVPFVPFVPGLEDYLTAFPGKVMHSKIFRTPTAFAGKRVLVIGNSASGHDITTALTATARLPVYVSRRSRSRWDYSEPPAGVAWRPVIERYCADTGSITFTDGTVLAAGCIDTVIYCTGYQASFPFWNGAANGGALWDYTHQRLDGNYLRTFFHDHPTLGIVGMPRTLTFRSFEYQAIALARVFARRNRVELPSRGQMQNWEAQRAEACRARRMKFHDIPWEKGEAMEFLQVLYEIAGLPTLDGAGKCPPVLDEATRWAVEHIRKYPEPGLDDLACSSHGHGVGSACTPCEVDDGDWVVVAGQRSRGLQVLP
ncbi:hypothetical protein LTR53_003984 [Teratosphaeriaceae sp. CCFEE 6253]|nr:hypothetical protein LTR53_003984 [Teratosphaeriaceae sp. CCFEE 6253]